MLTPNWLFKESNHIDHQTRYVRADMIHTHIINNTCIFKKLRGEGTHYELVTERVRKNVMQLSWLKEMCYTKLLSA